MARTDRARLKKNNVLASKSRLACRIADISISVLLRRLAGEGPFEEVVIVVEPRFGMPKFAPKFGRRLGAVEKKPFGGAVNASDDSDEGVDDVAGAVEELKLKFMADGVVWWGEGWTRRIFVIRGGFKRLATLDVDVPIAGVT